MDAVENPKLNGIDVVKSYIMGVILDDESLTLEMDFLLREDHPRFQLNDGEEACYRKGFMRFADFGDLRLSKAKVEEGKEVDLSDIYSAEFGGDYVFISSGWGEIELTAKSIQIAVD